MVAVAVAVVVVASALWLEPEMESYMRPRVAEAAPIRLFAELPRLLLLSLSQFGIRVLS